jgi:AcrR family transcriptional regulator
MATKPRNRKPLSKERVLEKAIALADKDGLDGLSMRKLGQALGVEAMSLYNHVTNKAELVAAMVDRVVEQFELPDGGRWDDAIRRCATSAYDLLHEHSWACSLAVAPSDTRFIGGPRIRYMEWLLRRLRGAGFSAELAYSAYHTVDSHIFGFTLWQQGHVQAAQMLAPDGDQSVEEWAARLLDQLRPQFPYLAEHGDLHMAESAPGGRHEFEFGLDLIIDGLKKRKRTALTER